MRTIHEVDQKWLFLIGLRESLNNLVLALCVVLVDALVVTLHLFWRGPSQQVGVGSAARAT